ncbi:hypothetical protein BC830DRAFT_1118718 [Chytriomyces sp. MP71]|nr:hypothetical protein BC830DRAFT_1118718 [Chytriomyces sp. MP71]
MMRVRGSHRPSDGPVPKGVPGQWSPALSHRTTLGSLAPGGHKKPALGSLDNNSFSDAYCASREQSEDESGSSGNNGSREFISSASSSSSSSLDLARHSGVSLVRKLTADKIRRRLNMSAASENSPETEYGSDDSSFDNVTIGSLSLQDKVKDSIDSLPLQLTERMVSSSLDNSSNDSISMTNRNSKRDQGSQDLTWSDNAKGGGAPTDLNNRLMMSSESSSLNHSTESITSRRFVSIAQKKNILSGSFASQQTEKPSKMTATDIIMKLAKDSSLDHIKNGDLDEVADKGARSSLPSKTKIGDLFPVLSKKERIASETPSESTEPGLEDLKKEFLNGPPTSRSALTKLERPLKSILKTASKPFIERKSSDGLHLLQESEERVTKVKWLQVYSSSNKKAQRIKKMDLV